VRNIDTEDRGELARGYLARARKHADELNEIADSGSRKVNNEDRQMLAVMNALVAIAMVQVPDEPGMRLA
jgi:ABC-type branched-subunit amino acid transport system ATPase component